MTKSLVRLQRVEPGIDVGNALALRIEASERRYREADLPRLYERILQGVHALPGTRAAALTGYLPLTDPGRTWRFSIEGRPASASGDEFFAVPAEVTHEIFAALGIARIDGRVFEPGDTANSPGVAVVSRTAARRFWPGASPVGHRIRIAAIDRVYSIVGVVADVHQSSLQDEPAPMLYTLLAQTPDATRSTWLVAKTAGDPLASTRAIQSVVHAVDASMPIDDVQTLEVIRRTMLDQPRFRTMMLASFAVVALILSAVGLYGVLAQFVGERRHEIGIRMALGATRRDVVNLAVVQAGRLLATGMTAGIVIAGASSQLIRGLLFHVGALDVSTFVLAASLFLLVGAAAAWLPARRAADIDPAVSLRAE
jgi:putative ABC transport system permease protein